MVSIVIVNWNSGPFLERCVRSLRENAAGCRIIVVDNASTDSSARFAETAGSELSLLRNASNEGFAAACNRGWKSACGSNTAGDDNTDCVLFLNPDTESFPGSVGCLERTLIRDPSVWAVGGCLVAADGEPQQEFNVRHFPTLGSIAADMFFIDEIRRTAGLKRRPGTLPSGDAVDVEQPAAACLMTTRAALETLGGFDETFYPAWFEDVDLCLRIRQRGGRIRYQPQARFLHHGGYSLNRLARQDFLKYFHTNQIRYFRKHGGRGAARRVRHLVILGLLLRTAASLVYPLVPNMSRRESAGVFRSALRSVRKSEEARA